MFKPLNWALNVPAFVYVCETEYKHDPGMEFVHAVVCIFPALPSPNTTEYTVASVELPPAFTADVVNVTASGALPDVGEAENVWLEGAQSFAIAARVRLATMP